MKVKEINSYVKLRWRMAKNGPMRNDCHSFPLRPGLFFSGKYMQLIKLQLSLIFQNSTVRSTSPLLQVCSGS